MSVQKINKCINKTKKTLKMYGCTFKEYMRDCGRRDDIDLGDTVSTKTCGDGVVIGWNGGCNYNVFLFQKQDIFNMHPNSVELKNKEVINVQ